MKRLASPFAGSIAIAAVLAFAAPVSAQDHSAHDMRPAEPMAEDAMGQPASAPSPDCSPEHARMGHCIPMNTPPAMATGTDLPPGDAQPPPLPGDWYADRIYPQAEMAQARHTMIHDDGGQTNVFLNFDLAEYQARKGDDGFQWSVEGWYGGDIERLMLKSQGEAVRGKGIEKAELQFLYSRAAGPYFNLHAGVRQDLGDGADRTYAVIGFEGLAPYWFDVEGALFLSNKGDLLGRLGGYYDQRITQRMILQPRTEVNFAFQDIREARIGSGFSDLEMGLRLRYEIIQEFAPYVGVEWTRKLGDTARFTRAAGEDADRVSFVIGVRTWF